MVYKMSESITLVEKMKNACKAEKSFEQSTKSSFLLVQQNVPMRLTFLLYFSICR